MRGRNFLELNCGTMIEVLQMWLNDRYITRGDDTVPVITGIEFLADTSPGQYTVSNNKINAGHYRLTLEDRAMQASSSVGVQAAGMTGPVQTVVQTFQQYKKTP